MTSYDSVFRDVLKEDVIAKGNLDLYVPGTVNRNLKAALVKKSNGGYLSAIVFDNVGCVIDVNDVSSKVMKQIPMNGTKGAVRLSNAKNGIELYTLVGDEKFIQKIFDEYKRARGE